MADTGISTISPLSAKVNGKQPASPNSESGEDDGNTPSLSPEYVAMALWGWSIDTFKDEAHSMYSQVCTMVGIPDKIAKRVRRKSMPAIPTLKSILKKPEVPVGEGINHVPPARPRAKSYSEPSSSAVSGAVTDLPVDAGAVAKLASSANALQATHVTSSICAPRMPADYGVQQQYDQSTLALMQYSEAGPPARSAVQAPLHQHRMLAHALPYMAPQAHSSYTAPVATPAHTVMQDDDASILMSAVDRCLIPAERLEPDQCQQVLAAHQRFKQPAYASRATAMQAGPAPTEHRHRRAHDRYRPIVIVPPPAPDLSQHPAYRGQVAGHQGAPNAHLPRRQPDGHPQLPAHAKHVRVDSRNQNQFSHSSSSQSRQWSSSDNRRHPGPLSANPTTPSSSTQPSSGQSGNRNDTARKLQSSPLVPQPLRLRTSIPGRFSSYDPQKADNNRITWRNDLNKEVSDHNAAQEDEQRRMQAQASQHARQKREFAITEARKQIEPARTDLTEERIRQSVREKYRGALLPDDALGDWPALDEWSRSTSELWKKEYGERRVDDEVRTLNQAAKAHEEEVLANQKYDLEQEFEQRLAAQVAVDDTSNIGITSTRKSEAGNLQSFFRKQLRSWGSKANFFQ